MTPYLVFFFLPVSALLFWIHNTKAGITPNLITHHLTVMVNMTAKIKLIPSSPSPPFSKPVFSPLPSLYCVWTHDTVTKTNNLWVTERDAKVRFSVCFSLVQWIYLCSMSSTLSSIFSGAPCIVFPHTSVSEGYHVYFYVSLFSSWVTLFAANHILIFLCAFFVYMFDCNTVINWNVYLLQSCTW